MIVTHEREKLIHAMNFFARNTQKFGKTKLYKLLYFLDFEHFKQTGRSVTGLRYNAWKMGPVPVALHNEIPEPKPDMVSVVQFTERPVANGTMLAIESVAPFASEIFSPRELRIMGSLAAEHFSAHADAMVEATHLESLPWDKIYNKDRNPQAEIPYDLAVRADERDLLLKIASDREELLANLK